MKLSKNKAKEQDPVGQKVCGNSTAQPPLPRRVVSKQLRAEQIMYRGIGNPVEYRDRPQQGKHTWNCFGTESCTLTEYLGKYRLAVRYQRLV